MQLTRDELCALLQGILAQNLSFRLIFNDPRQKATDSARKITIRQINIGSAVKWQVALWDGKQEKHLNLSEAELFESSRWSEWLKQFKQLQVQSTEQDFHVFSNNDGSLRMLKKKAQKIIKVEQHNRSKNYLLQEGEAVPFLVRLGVMQSDGRVVKSHYDKFRQINRFMEMVEDIYDDLPSSGTLKIVDFGCGRSYLTFAIHWLFNVYHQRKVSICGLDLNPEVIKECQGLTDDLELMGLHFEVGDIAHWVNSEVIDLVVSLHACDTATDAALAQAVRWQTNVILAAPCCQHEIAPQLNSVGQEEMLRQGIFRERLGAIVTDALRTSALEVLGYNCQVLEFIDLAHTPKNLLIRAVRRSSGNYKDSSRYHELKKSWQIQDFSLEKFLVDHNIHTLAI